jgi:hypothetical protein
VQWLLGQETVYEITGKSGISQARKRLGWEAVKAIHDEVVRPIAEKQTAFRGVAGEWYACPVCFSVGELRLRRVEVGRRK